MGNKWDNGKKKIQQWKKKKTTIEKKWYNNIK
jgi:hypothetical protein